MGEEGGKGEFHFFSLFLFIFYNGYIFIVFLSEGGKIGR